MSRQRPSPLRQLTVHRLPGRRHQGILLAGSLAIPVAIGRSGIAFDKKEGDGRSPAGSWRILKLLYRADKAPRPVTRLAVAPIRRDDGWCDAPAHRRYNRPVKLPFPASHERMWRDDHLYDLVLVIDHNTRPRVAGRGSAVFAHLARPGFSATEGCVAFRPADLRRLLPRLSRDARLVIG